MFVLFSTILLGGVVAFAIPPFLPPEFKSALINSIVRGVGAIIIAFGIATTSYNHVGDGHLGQLFRIYGGDSLTDGKIIAINGEKGAQGDILRPGFHPSFLVNILYKVDTDKKDTIIPDGKLGVLVAKDGAALRPGQAFADPFPANLSYTMLDAETFLKNGGQRGPQLTVLQPGTYPLNDYLWQVDIKDAKSIETGQVGVVKSNVWADIDFGTLKANKPTDCSVMMVQDKSEGRIETPIVPVGCVGVWKESLPPGKYYFNPDAFIITEIDTRVQVWTYAGGYNRCEISLNVDAEGELKQDRSCKDIQVNEDDADRAVFVKMEGWDIPLELRALAQVSPENASCVVAGVGTLKQVEDLVLTPSIRAIVRDVAGGTYDVEEIKLDENGKPVLVDGKPVIQNIKRPTKALDLINQRPLIENEIERRIRPEAAKSCVIIREVRLGEPAIPPELLVAVRREQLATQLSKAYIQEQLAQTQRIASEKAKATANGQKPLAEAEIEVQTSEREAQAARNSGQGEKDRLELLAQGQRAQADVLGPNVTADLQKFNVTIEKIFAFMDKHPDAVTTAFANASKLVPNVQVNGAGGGTGLIDALLGSALSKTTQGQGLSIAEPLPK